MYHFCFHVDSGRTLHVSLTMDASKPKTREWHSAKQGLLGKTADNSLHCITCDHVTFASDGSFYMDFGDRQKHLISVLEHRRSQRSEYDIDCFRVNDHYIAYFRKNQDKFEKCRVFDKQKYHIHNMRVYRRNDSMDKVIGRVISAEEHQLCGKNYGIDVENKFLVVLDSDRETDQTLGAFAAKGNSGDYVAIEINGYKYIVGIITDGDYVPQHRKGKRPYTICLFIQTALKALRKTFQELYCCSFNFFFKSPEKINPYAFDLSDQLLTLTCMKFPEVDGTKLQDQMRYEKSLSALIDSRSEITSSIFPEDDPVQACVKNSVLACSYLWSNDLKKTEKCLKDAVRAMPSTEQMCLQMLCKVITYVTWYYRIANKEDGTRNKLLKEGLQFIEESKTNSTYPRSSQFYMFFEYTMFYFARGENENATKYSAKAIEHSLESLADNPGSVSSRNRLVLAVCQYANIKLRCGDNMETKDIDVSPDVVDDVKRRLEDIKNITSDPTAKSYYLLKMSDLSFRKHDVKNALEWAYQCRDLARKTKLKKDRNEAICRIRVLQGYF